MAVTCLLSLIPMKVPAMNPFWQQDSFQSHAAALAQADDVLKSRALGSRRGMRFGTRNACPMLSALDPLAPQSSDRTYDLKLRLRETAHLYAGIRANPRIPVKRVRQIALPPPTPFHLRAPPARA